MSLKVSSSRFFSRNLMIKNILSSSVLGYLAGKIFTAINPASAVAFNVVAEIAHHLGSALFKKFNIFNNSKLKKGLITSIASFGAAFWVVNTIGKLSLIQALKVSALTVITQIAVANILGLAIVLGSFAIFSLKATMYIGNKLKSLTA